MSAMLARRPVRRLASFARTIWFRNICLHCRSPPPHRPREVGLAHPADTSRSNLAAALALGGGTNPDLGHATRGAPRAREARPPPTVLAPAPDAPQLDARAHDTYRRVINQSIRERTGRLRRFSWLACGDEQRALVAAAHAQLVVQESCVHPPARAATAAA